MLEKFRHYRERIKEGMLRDMWRQTLWIYEYARLYWKQMIFYTVLGLAGTLVSLISSLISRDMVDIVTGQQAGLLARTFCLYIGFSVGSVPFPRSPPLCEQDQHQRDNAIKADIFEKMLLTDLGVNPELPHGRSFNALEFGCLQYFKRCPKLDSESRDLYGAFCQHLCGRVLP